MEYIQCPGWPARAVVVLSSVTSPGTDARATKSDMMDHMPKRPLESLLQTATECHALIAAIDVPHVIIGGLAVCLHGYDRGSRDVDLLVRYADWEQVRQALESAQYKWNDFRRAYYSPASVRVDFRFGGENSSNGDVGLPDPRDDRLRQTINGLPVLALEELLQTKIRCGFDGQRRGGRWARRSMKHFDDVVGLIKSNDLLT
jgi:hypothetical protein